MLKEEYNIRDLASQKKVSFDYVDDDIILVDNLNFWAAPRAIRLAVNAIFFVASGRGEFIVNGQKVVLLENHLIICPPGVGFSNFTCTPNFKVNAAYFSNAFLQSCLRDKIDVWNELIYARQVRVLMLEGENIAFYQKGCSFLRDLVQSAKNHPFYEELVRSLVQFGIQSLNSGLVMFQGTVPPNSGGKRPDKLFKRFIDLLHSTSGRHCTVESMAEKLCVSPKHLSNVCKKNSGKTASAWIEEQVLEEIRYNLQETDLSIKQICYELGFSSPSFFCKYVKTHFGMTPLELRRS